MTKLQKQVSEEENLNAHQSSSTSLDISALLPVDLFFDIFSRLPQKSIAKFRCVSKLWSSILSRPDFIDLIVKRSLARPRLLFSVYTRKWNCFFSSPQHIKPGENLPLTAVAHPTPFPPTIGLDITAPVHGLLYAKVLGIKGGWNVMVCNPSTGQYIRLPPCRRYQSLSQAKHNVRIYLGYDPVNRQYKVLCISGSNGEEHKVVTLTRGKTSWRNIECSLPAYYPSDAGVCINGVLYYIADPKEIRFPRTYIIVCFDVMSEKFTFIVPALDMHLSRYSSVLINYTGKLGVLGKHLQFDSGTATSLEWWVLDGVKEHKWLKKIHVLLPLWKNLIPDDTRLYIVGMTCNGEFVFYQGDFSDPFYIFFYNVDTDTFKRLEIQGMGPVRSQRIEIFIDHIEDMRWIA